MLSIKSFIIFSTLQDLVSWGWGTWFLCPSVLDLDWLNLLQIFPHASLFPCFQLCKYGKYQYPILCWGLIKVNLISVWYYHHDAVTRNCTLLHWCLHLTDGSLQDWTAPSRTCQLHNSCFGKTWMIHMYIQFYHLFSVVVKHFLYVEEEWRLLVLENKGKMRIFRPKKTKTWNDSVM